MIFLNLFYMLSQKDQEYKNYMFVEPALHHLVYTDSLQAYLPQTNFSLKFTSASLPCLTLSADNSKRWRKAQPSKLSLSYSCQSEELCESERRKQNTVLEKPGRFSDGHVHVYVSLSLWNREHDAQQIYPTNLKGEDDDPGFGDKKATAHTEPAPGGTLDSVAIHVHSRLA